MDLWVIWLVLMIWARLGWSWLGWHMNPKWTGGSAGPGWSGMVSPACLAPEGLLARVKDTCHSSTLRLAELFLAEVRSQGKDQKCKDLLKPRLGSGTTLLCHTLFAKPSHKARRDSRLNKQTLHLMRKAAKSLHKGTSMGKRWEMGLLLWQINHHLDTWIYFWNLNLCFPWSQTWLTSLPFSTLLPQIRLST